jgi:hypothetical protein
MAYTGGKLYTYRGEQMTLGQLAALAKVRYGVLSYRLNRLHWQVEDAVDKPVVSRSEAGRRGKETAKRQFAL